MKHPLLALALGLSVLGLCPACVVYDDDTHHHNGAMDHHWGIEDGADLIATIDVGERIEVDPGVGAGVFVEVDSGGTWHVFCACDTVDSGAECSWDIAVSAPFGESLEVVGEEDIEAHDEVWILDPGAVRLLTSTGEDFDGFRLEAVPGLALRFDMLLDGVRQPRFLNWVGEGEIQQGADELPIVLEPREGAP